MTDLLELAARCEAAEVSEQARMLCEAHEAITGLTLHDDDAWRFRSMIAAGAYESAAMTLVPEEHTFCLWQDHRGNCAQVRKPSPFSRGIVVPIVSGIATPALALCAASLRARATQGPTHDR